MRAWVRVRVFWDLCLSTQGLYIQKENNELYKLLKFRVNWANIEQDPALQKLQYLLRNVSISGHSGQASVRQSIHLLVSF